MLKVQNIFYSLISSLLSTLFLFYIDEGAYRLSREDVQRNTGIFLSYLAAIFVAQMFLAPC